MRRTDAILFKPGASGGYLDLTIRFESHNIGQAEEVDDEKNMIYEPIIPIITFFRGSPRWLRW